LNLLPCPRDQGVGRIAAALSSWGQAIVKTVRPNTTDPIPLRTSPPKIGTIMVRFVVLLVVAVGLLALAWSR
jgi:hypothetical protein